MIEKIIISSLFTFAAWYTMQEEEIFSFVANIFMKILPRSLWNPAFDCSVCMGFWYGSIAYWVVFHNSWKEWLVVAICTVGLNAVITRLWSKNEENKDNVCCGEN